MNEIQIYNHEQLGSLRCFMNNEGRVYFIACDVARGLGYSSTAALTRTLDEDEKGVQILHTLGGEQRMTIISESGFYHAALKSRVEKAKVFRRWVTSEVLPQIARTGGYIPVRKEDSPEELMARALLVAQKTIEQRDALLEEKQRVIEEQRPKADFCDAVMASVNSCLIGNLAKLIRQNGVECGERRLFCWLRENDYLGKRGERYNIPNQRYIDQELFELKETVHTENERLVTRYTTKVTGKGQEYFVNGFISGRFALD